MDFSFSMGGLIPLWMLGGPLLAALAALVALTTLPTPLRRDQRDTRMSGSTPVGSGGLSSGRQ